MRAPCGTPELDPVACWPGPTRSTCARPPTTSGGSPRCSWVSCGPSSTGLRPGGPDRPARSTRPCWWCSTRRPTSPRSRPRRPGRHRGRPRHPAGDRLARPRPDHGPFRAPGDDGGQQPPGQAVPVGDLGPVDPRLRQPPDRRRGAPPGGHHLGRAVRAEHHPLADGASTGPTRRTPPGAARLGRPRLRRPAPGPAHPADLVRRPVAAGPGHLRRPCRGRTRRLPPGPRTGCVDTGRSSTDTGSAVGAVGTAPRRGGAMRVRDGRTGVDVVVARRRWPPWRWRSPPPPGRPGPSRASGPPSPRRHGGAGAASGELVVSWQPPAYDGEFINHFGRPFPT